MFVHYAQLMDLEAALSDLVDDKNFVTINSVLSKFNLFEAIGGVRAELRHSNFLAFLLSPDRPHGLDSRPLKATLRAMLTGMPSDVRPLPILKIILADLDDVRVLRESDYIDILVELRSLKLVVLIENKVGSTAGDGQLAKYRAVVERRYPSWRKLFVYLTPSGESPDDTNYISFSYSELAEVIDSLLEETTASRGSEMELVLRHYVEMLRRNVVEDEELREMASQLYERHAQALDFIFKCKPQGTSLLPVAQSLAEKTSGLAADKASANIYRFYIQEWEGLSALNRCPADRWTKTGRNLLFEIKSFKTAGEYSDRILLSLILGPSESDLRQYLFDGARAAKDAFTNCGKTIGQSWVTLFSRELLSEAAAEGMDDTQKQTTIAENWTHFADVQLPVIRKAIREIATKAPT